MRYADDELGDIDREEMRREERWRRRMDRHRAIHWHPNDPDYAPGEPEDGEAE